VRTLAVAVGSVDLAASAERCRHSPLVYDWLELIGQLDWLDKSNRFPSYFPSGSAHSSWPECWAAAAQVRVSHPATNGGGAAPVRIVQYPHGSGEVRPPRLPVTCRYLGGGEGSHSYPQRPRQYTAGYGGSGGSGFGVALHFGAREAADLAAVTSAASRQAFELTKQLSAKASASLHLSGDYKAAQLPSSDQALEQALQEGIESD
jgi:hypothetical protein